MIAGIILIVGGLAHLAAGWITSAAALTAVGGLWIVAGIINSTTSRIAARGLPPARDARDPALRRQALRRMRGVPLRGLITLVCAGAAIAVGIAGIDSATTSDAWRALPIGAGIVMATLSLMGLMMYGATGVERSATQEATVVILGFQDRNVVSGGRPLVRFVFDVYPTGMTNYQATVDTNVPLLAIPHLAVGAQFAAHVAGPDKPENVIVDWTAPTTAT